MKTYTEEFSTDY